MTTRTHQDELPPWATLTQTCDRCPQLATRCCHAIGEWPTGHPACADHYEATMDSLLAAHGGCMAHGVRCAWRYWLLTRRGLRWIDPTIEWYRAWQETRLRRQVATCPNQNPGFGGVCNHIVGKHQMSHGLWDVEQVKDT